MKKENNYVAKFNRIMLSSEPIYNKDGKELILEDDEEFRQCYANTPARRSGLSVTRAILSLYIRRNHYGYIRIRMDAITHSIYGIKKNRLIRRLCSIH